MENEELYRGLVVLLRLFKNRPYHLAKYLVENSALTDEFIKKIKESEKLKEFLEDENQNFQDTYFADISQMENYFNLLTDIDVKEKGIKQITKELNDKLNDCVRLEKYEEAARIRDYMVRKGIKRN